MKQKQMIVGSVAMIVSIAFLLVHGDSGGRTVRASKPAPIEVIDIKDLAQLKEPFQRDRDTVRLIALLSPVCPACRSGFSDMQKTLKAIPDDRLKVHIVWLPMFPGDSRKWAQIRSDEFSDKRVSYYWDGEKLAGQAWQKVLGTNREAWDVYLLYGAGTQWDKEPATPDFWMHQLSGITTAPRLDEEAFQAKTKELLSKVKR
jgi:hypothetical protein